MHKVYSNAHEGPDTMPLSIYSEKELFSLPVEENQSYISVYYDNCIYLIECFGSEPNKQLKMHIFSTKQKQWKCYLTSFQKAGGKSSHYYPKLGATYALIEDNIYIFGGKQSKGKIDNRLCMLNLQKKTWRVDIDTPNPSTAHISPQARSNSSLLAFKQDYLILCGSAGPNIDIQTSMSLWLFDIKQYCWLRSATLSVPNYFNISTCIDNDKMYIFGTKMCNGNNNTYYTQSHLIQVGIQRCMDSYKPPLLFNMHQVYNSSNRHNYIQPNPQSKYKIVRYQQKLLILLETVERQGKANSSSTRVWFFDSMTFQWQLTQIQLNIRPEEVLVDSNVSYICDYNQSILKLYIPESEIKMLKAYVRYKEWRKCEICYQTLINKNNLMEPAFKLSKQLMDSLTQKIKFPFSALALFAEIGISHSATYINFHYDMYKYHPILKIQDDNRSNFTNQQLEEVIVNFEAEVNLNFGSIDKRVRAIMSKDFLKKQMGTNLKIAAMRLGNEMLHVSLTPNYEARVAYFYLENDEYVCYYYVFNERTNRVLQEYSLQAKLFVQSKYDDLIKEALHETINNNKFGTHKNTTFILGLKNIINEQGVTVPEIEPLVTNEQRDVLYISYNPSIYKVYLDYGSKINESIDVSLCTYMSLLFMKNDNMKISVQLYKFQRKVVRREQCYQNVDKYAWTKFVSPIDNSLKNYDLKMVDLMVNNKLNKKMGLFHNGILMYHKNRLVKRFDCELGTLLNHLQFKQQVCYGYFNVFGSIQLPDAIEPNQQKTDFVNEIMLQKLYSRLKVIQEISNRNIMIQKQQLKGMLTRQKLKDKSHEENEIRHNPVKKVKKSHEDESYSLD